MKINQEFIVREIAGETLLVPVGETAIKVHGMISLSESGLLIYNMLQNGCNEDELIKAMLSEYEVDENTAKEDVEAFLNQLRALDLLEEN